MQGGACVLLRPLEQSRVAEDLGWIKRHRPSYVLLDKARFARLATAEAHLSDAFDFPQFEHVLISGQEPEAGDLLQFRRTFGFEPQHLSALGTLWSLRTLRPKQDSAEVLQSEEIWRILRNTAAGIFRVAPEALQLDSSADNTKGWNSLGYLQLVMAVEEAFGRNLSPRDVMAVRQLRDLVSILGNPQP
jgi:acyl carrier protein